MRVFYQWLKSIQPSHLTVMIMFLAITLGFLLAVSFAVTPLAAEPRQESQESRVMNGTEDSVPSVNLMQNYARARHYLSIRDADHAIDFYEAVLDADETNVRARHDLARAYLLNDEPDEALAAINRALELDPVQGGLYFTQARILDAQEKFHEALESYLVFAALNPDDLVTVDALGRAQTLMNRLEEDITAEELIRYRGMLFLGLGFPQDAVHHLRNARLADTDDAQTLFLMGRAYQYLDEPDEAIPLYREALENDEDNPLYWYYLSSGHRQAGNTNEALAAWREFVQEAPHSLANVRHIPSFEMPDSNHATQ